MSGSENKCERIGMTPDELEIHKRNTLTVVIAAAIATSVAPILFGVILYFLSLILQTLGAGN